MTTDFYLPRKIYDHEKEYSELEVLEAFQIIIILAEPGAGKSSLLESFSSHLSIKKKTANIFNCRNNHDENSILIIDALDELVRIDQSAVSNLLGKAAELEPKKLIISSRSSEWEESYTSLVRDIFEIEPRVFRLLPFNESEQQLIFENYKAEENFQRFVSEVKKYNLEQLVSNPQFLKIFADAYIESNRVFPDRKSIFSQAVTALAKETNKAFNVRNDLRLIKKIESTNEIFAKLLLSGSEGVSTNVDGLNTLYPRIDTLIKLDNVDLYPSLLSSRLFKLGENESIHQPSHKIIAEFTAANYLVKKINADRNNISLHQCLSIIAPNGIVRDELRGLVAWMAALGDKYIQETLINIDPYAVLANGDPSQLLPSSKKYLLEKLICLVEEDPYFRRSDMWRTFSISGFFDNDSVTIVKHILAKSDKGLLRGLVLELIEKSIILEYLLPELEEIVINEKIDKYIRELAAIRLTEIVDYEIGQIIHQLIEQSTEVSLYIVAHLIERVNIKSISSEVILKFLEKCTSLYPNKDVGLEITIGKHYFIKAFIINLNYELVVNLLNKLSHNLCCTCRKQYDCYCRNGISKIIGMLLDRYFELEKNSYDPQKIWSWLKNLNFHGSKREDDSIAVKVLQNDDHLRQNLIRLAFYGITSIEDINQISWKTLSSYTHSGLCLKLQDYYSIIDWAFEYDNVNLWTFFSPTHHFYASDKNEANYALRKYAKSQAREKKDFLKAWTKKNLAAKKNYLETQKIVNRRRIKNGKLKRQKIRNENILYIQQNRELIEAGKHFGCLIDFAAHILDEPERIEIEFGDGNLVRNALKNCLPFLESRVPSLSELAKAQCSSTSYHSEIVLYAACLQIYKEHGSLEGVQLELLKALRTGIDMHSSRAVSNAEKDTLKNEIERIIFPDSNSRLEFIKDYIEPQLAYNDCQHTKVSWLRYSDTFKDFQTTLPLEWLHRYPNISIDTLKILFNLSAEFCDNNKLKKIIAVRCTELNEQLKLDLENIDQKVVMFWFVRAFLFLDELEIEFYWEYLKKQDNIIFILNDRIEGIGLNEFSNWPALTPTKIWWILDEFIDQWPQVDLPNSWGTGDPPNQIAYRFLSNLIWNFSKHVSDSCLSIVNKLILDSRFDNMQLDLKSIRSSLIRSLALVNFKAPSSEEVVNFLDNDGVITVEGLRALILEELEFYQNDLQGGDTTSSVLFYHQQYDESTSKISKYIHLNEVDATKIVSDRLKLRLSNKGIIVTLEHQMQHANRCDITFTKIIDNQRKLLVLESKGQWHKELYNAASTQLAERYSTHPDAEQQGIYFVLWFGPDEKVANKTKHDVSSALELKITLENALPNELKGRIDIFVLDVSL